MRVTEGIYPMYMRIRIDLNLERLARLQRVFWRPLHCYDGYNLLKCIFSGYVRLPSEGRSCVDARALSLVESMRVREV